MLQLTSLGINFLPCILLYYVLLAEIIGRLSATEETDLLIKYQSCLPSHSLLFQSKCIGCLIFDEITSPTDSDQTKKQYNFMEGEEIEDIMTNLKEFDNFSFFNCAKSLACVMNPTAIRALRTKKGMAFLSARELQVVTIERKPFSQTSNSTYTGVIFEFLSALSKKYNFTMNIFLPDDGNWGAKEKDGTWNGMLSDLGAASFSITLDRAQAVAFTTAFHQEPSAILIPPPHGKQKLSVLIHPLSKEVWVAVFVTIGVIAPSLFLFHILSLKISGNYQELDKKSVFEIMGQLFNFLVGSLVQISVTSPTNKTTRFLVALWWMSSLTIANVYIAFLMSYLSTPKLYNIVDNLDGLTHQKVIKWTFRKNAALQDLFMSENSLGVYKSIGEGVREHDLVISDYDGVTQVLSGKFAFIKEKSFLDVAIDKDYEETRQCRLSVAKETFFSVGIALAVRKKSPMLELLNSEILRSVSTGVMEKWKTIHWPKDLWCNDATTFLISTRPRTRKLSLDDTQGAYFLWSCGIIFSIFCFASEMLYGRIKYYSEEKSEKKRVALQLIRPVNSFNGYSWVVRVDTLRPTLTNK